MKEIKTDKLKETAIDNIGYIGAFVILLAIIIAGFVLFDFNEDGKVNWADVLFNGVLGIVAFMLSRHQGVVNGTKSPTHQANYAAYGKKVSAIIESNAVDGIEEFCRERTLLREQEKRENIMLKVCIGAERFAWLQTLADEQRAKVLDKKQMRAYRKATGRIKVTPVSPKAVLADMETNDYSLDVTAPSKAKDAWEYVRKAFTSIFFPVAVAFIEVTASHDSAAAIIFSIVMRAFVIGTSFAMGMFSGVKKAQLKDSIVRNRIVFLSLYDTWRNKKTTKVDIKCNTI